MQKSKIFAPYLHQTIKVGFFIILFLPLFVEQRFLFPFVFPKTVVFRIIVEIIFVLYLFLLAFSKEYAFRWTKTHTLLGILVIILGASALFGVNPYHSFWSSVERSEGVLLWIHLFLLFIVLGGIHKTRDDWHGTLRVAMFANALQVVYALSQYFNFSYALKTSGERLGGSIGNPSFLAAYLVLMLVILGYLIFETKSKFQRVLYGVLCVLNIFLIWQTQTRGAVLGLIFGSVIFLTWKWYHSPSRKTKNFLGTAGALIVLAVSFVMLSKNADWIQRSPTLTRIVSISPKEASTQNRLIVWKVGWQAFLERPLIGWGWENFYAAFNAHVDPRIARDIGSRPWYDRAHNTVVELAVTTGILGIIFYLSIFFRSFWIVVKSVRKKILSQNIGAVLISGLSAYFFQNLFVFDTLSSYTLFFLLLGFINGLEPELAPKKAVTTQKSQANIPLIKFLAGISLPILFVSTYIFNVRPALANYFVVRAVTREKSNVSESIRIFQKAFSFSPPKSQEYRFILVQHARDQASTRGWNPETFALAQYAMVEMEQSIKADPHAAQNYLILAELYFSADVVNTGFREKAEALALDALEKFPRRYQTYSLLGRIKISQGKFGESIRYFEKAVELNEYFVEAQWNLAIAYILKGDIKQALEHIKKSKGSSFDPYLYDNITKIIAAVSDSKNFSGTKNFYSSLLLNTPDTPDYEQSKIILRDIINQSQ